MSKEQYESVSIALKKLKKLLNLSKDELEFIIKLPASDTRRVYLGMKPVLCEILYFKSHVDRRMFLRNLMKYKINNIVSTTISRNVIKKSIEKRKISKDAIESLITELKQEHPDRTDYILKRAAICKHGQDLKKKYYEDLFAKILLDMDISFVRQKIFMNDFSFYIVDFYLPEYNVVCEIDGFSHADNEWMDEKRTRVLINQNNVRDVIRFFNDEVKDAPKVCAESLDIVLSNL